MVCVVTTPIYIVNPHEERVNGAQNSTPPITLLMIFKQGKCMLELCMTLS